MRSSIVGVCSFNISDYLIINDHITGASLLLLMPYYAKYRHMLTVFTMRFFCGSRDFLTWNFFLTVHEFLILCWPFSAWLNPKKLFFFFFKLSSII